MVLFLAWLFNKQTVIYFPILQWWPFSDSKQSFILLNLPLSSRFCSMPGRHITLVLSKQCVFTIFHLKAFICRSILRLMITKKVSSGSHLANLISHLPLIRNISINYSYIYLGLGSPLDLLNCIYLISSIMLLIWNLLLIYCGLVYGYNGYMESKKKKISVFWTQIGYLNP